MKDKLLKTKMSKKEMAKRLFNYRIVLESLRGTSVEVIAKEFKVSLEEVREGFKCFYQQEPDKYRLRCIPDRLIEVDMSTRTSRVVYQTPVLTGIYIVKPEIKQQQGKV